MSPGLIVQSWELGPFAERTVLLGDPTSREAVLVDPGFGAETIVAAVQQDAWQLVAIVLTHAHLDHAMGARACKQAFPTTPLLLHPADLPLLESLAEQARLFGFSAPAPVQPDGWLADRQVLRVGNAELEVRHCPGHSPGHVVLLCHDPQLPFAVVGDVLFANGVGRTDLWGGSWEALERSIRTVLYALPDHTRVIPGHGPETTIGEEKASNPFVAMEGS